MINEGSQKNLKWSPTTRQRTRGDVSRFLDGRVHCSLVLKEEPSQSQSIRFKQIIYRDWSISRDWDKTYCAFCQILTDFYAIHDAFSCMLIQVGASAVVSALDLLHGEDLLGEKPRHVWRLGENLENFVPKGWDACALRKIWKCFESFGFQHGLLSSSYRRKLAGE